MKRAGALIKQAPAILVAVLGAGFIVNDIIVSLTIKRKWSEG